MSGFGNTTDLLAASVSLSVCGLMGFCSCPPPPLPEAAYAVLSGMGEEGWGGTAGTSSPLQKGKQLREVKALAPSHTAGNVKI